MENIVFTYHFLNDKTAFSIISLDDYESIKVNYPNYREVMMDEKVNPFGVRPTYVSVDLYEDAELIDIESKIGSTEYLLGIKTTGLSGTFIKQVEII